MENHTEVDGDCLSFEEDGYDGISEQEETLLYFGGLFSREENVRQKFMDNFSRSVKTWVGKTDDISAQSMLQAHLPTALRLSINAPYKDIRERFTDLLREVQVSGVGQCGVLYCIVTALSSPIVRLDYGFASSK